MHVSPSRFLRPRPPTGLLPPPPAPFPPDIPVPSVSLSGGHGNSCFLPAGPVPPSSLWPGCLVRQPCPARHVQFPAHGRWRPGASAPSALLRSPPDWSRDHRFHAAPGFPCFLLSAALSGQVCPQQRPVQRRA